ncbi:MAG: hypothetical protein HYV63_28215 [Candidatus Schekmanbacteria bacterium]|nr:hypothetical protein [Candidatus Schekmanbacteria bacterium]
MVGSEAERKKLDDLGELVQRDTVALAKEVVSGLSRKALPKAVRKWLPEDVDLADLARGDQQARDRLVGHLVKTGMDQVLPEEVKSWLPSDTDFQQLAQGEKGEWGRIGKHAANGLVDRALRKRLGGDVPAGIDWTAIVQGDGDELGRAAAAVANRQLQKNGMADGGWSAYYDNGNFGFGRKVEGSGGGTLAGSDGLVSFRPYGSTGETLWEDKNFKSFGEVNKIGRDEALGEYYLRGSSFYGTAARTYRDQGKGTVAYGVEGFAGVGGAYEFGQRQDVGSFHGRPITVESNGSVHGSAGVTGRAEARASWGNGDYGVHLGGEVFAGAQVGAEMRTDVSVGDYHLGGVYGSAEGRAGIGVGAGVDLGYEDGQFRFGVGVGVTYGLGFDVDYGVAIDFKEIGRMGREEGWDDAAGALAVAGHKAFVEAPAKQLHHTLEKNRKKAEKAMRKAFGF